MRNLIIALLVLFTCLQNVWAAPNAAGSEGALSLPPGCEVIGGEYRDSRQKCQIDSEGNRRCYVPRVNCCGNGRLDGELIDANSGHFLALAESCELGEPGCREDCSRCGDGRIDVGSDEDCDRGPQNGLPNSGCTTSCTEPECGNGIYEVSNPETEQCDGSQFPESLSGLAYPPTCDDDCKVHYCGDGVKDSGEQCDGSDLGGLRVAGVSCQPDCRYTPYCGDGIKSASEACDLNDFGTLNNPNATCKADCQFNPYCGDGVVQARYKKKSQVRTETCDDGNFADGDGCAANCRFECRYIRATADYITYDGVARKAVVARGISLEELPCLGNFLGTNFKDIYTRQGNSRNNSVNATWTDDRLILKMLAYVYSKLPECAADSACNAALDPFISDTYEVDQVVSEQEQANSVAARTYLEGVLGKFRCDVAGRCPDERLRALMRNRNLAFDRSCDLVNLPHNYHEEQICGSVTVRAFASPISLIFNENQAEHQEQKLVQFALDPNQPKAWTLWRAVPENPLLVVLNESTAEVKDGSQLLGNWTAGGRNSSFQKTSLGSGSSSSEAWENGFEALAQFDLNQDGEVSGAELSPLGLWFDKNQNAIADAGEVTSAVSHGLTRLFYKGYFKSKESRDLHLPIGFELKTNAGLKRGGAIDWYAATFNSVGEGLSYLSGLSSNVTGAAGSSSESETAAQSLALDSDLSGTWIWGLNDRSKNVVPMGVLFLDVNEGRVQGDSFGEQQVNIKEQRFEVSSLVQMLSLEGQVSKRGQIDFSIKSEDGMAITASQAKLVAPGRMEGTSKMSSTSDSSESVGYDWVAVKIAE